jgi:hypothetical protein
MSPEKIRDLVLRLLAIVQSRQHHPRDRSRFRPFPLFNLVQWAVHSGAPVDYSYGPWRVEYRRLTRPGRHGLDFIPVVKRRVSEIMVDSLGQAVRLAGFLNWCGVPELTPAS